MDLVVVNDERRQGRCCWPSGAATTLATPCTRAHLLIAGSRGGGGEREGLLLLPPREHSTFSFFSAIGQIAIRVNRVVSCHRRLSG